MTTRRLAKLDGFSSAKAALLTGAVVLAVGGGTVAFTQHASTFGLRGTFTVLGDEAKQDGGGCFGAYWYLDRNSTYIRQGASVAVYEPDGGSTRVGALSNPVYGEDNSCTFTIDVPSVRSGEPYYLIAVDGVPGHTKVTEQQSRSGRIALDDSDTRGRLRLNNTP